MVLRNGVLHELQSTTFFDRFRTPFVYCVYFFVKMGDVSWFALSSCLLNSDCLVLLFMAILISSPTACQSAITAK